ncbi:alpha/beta hydrolase [Congregibacter variabilis]|uniref:Alpha/beta hydrolase n=1 Tax=Congregibacter variabilis TaxID=3081200 RepID=A0ABZ0HZZ6_9GAMM|nr:alpha/beta hydrolase [Congregibacter sp. IMCC43200]
MPEISETSDLQYTDLWYESADGLRLYARDYPGPESSQLLPVLCMHGLTRNSADFAWIAAHLAKTRRVVSVDQRGRGLSAYDSNPANYTPATYVEDMFTLLDKLAIDRMLIIGTSMGGLMSMLMANMQPERFAAVVLNDIGPELDPVGLERIKNYVGKHREIRNWDDAVAQTREINEVAFPSYTDEEWLRFTKGLYREVDGVPQLAHDAAIAQAILEADGNAVPPDLWPLFANMAAIPMLLVRGAVTDLVAMDCVEKMQKLSPGLQVVNIPERGHAPMLDEPLAVEAIDEFFSSVDPG